MGRRLGIYFAWLVVTGCGSVSEPPDGGADAQADAAPDVSSTDASDAHTQYICAGALSSKSCTNNGCTWRLGCASDAGFCSGPDLGACPNLKCKPNEACIQTFGRGASGDPCVPAYLCVDCDPTAPYPYNCADAGP